MSNHEFRPSKPVPTHLLRRRKVQLRLRRRQYLVAHPLAFTARPPESPEETPSAAPDSPAAIPQGLAMISEKGLEKMRQSLAMARELAKTASEERDALREQLERAEARAAEAENMVQPLRDEVENRKGAAEEVQKLAEQARQQMARTRADMDQLRKRIAKEKEEMRETAEAGLLRTMLPMLDNFHRALENSDQAADAEALAKGMKMIFRDLMNSLGNEGLKQLVPNGEPFDPNLHDAATIVSRDDLPDGVVAETLRPGYSFRGRVLRPAMVVVNKIGETPVEPHPEASAPSDEADEESSSPLDRAWRYLETRFDD